MQTFSRKNLTLYLILSFVLSWTIWIPVALSGRDYQSSPYLLAGTLVGAFGPGLAAILINYIRWDMDRITDFRQRIYDFKRIRPSWYLIILLIWPVFHGISIGITTLLGESIPSSGFLSQLLAKPNTIPLLIFMYFLQAGLEELGWRGYLQEQLGLIMNRSLSSLLVGVIHTIWHLPLFWVVGTNQMKMGFGGDFLVFVLFVISSSVLTAWCYYGNNRSIMAAALLHTTGNLSFDIFAYAPSTTKHLVFVLVTSFTAILILVYFQVRERKIHSQQNN
jgi:membrane protease YdiL (CAAX protease family)